MGPRSPECPMTAAALFLSLSALAGTHPAGETIADAAAIDVTPAGFDALGEVVPAMLPSEIPIDAQSGGYEGALGQCWLGGYAYALEDAWVGVSVQDATIVPRDGYLELDVDLLVWLNDGSDPFSLYTEFECIGDTCDGNVEPFNATVTSTIALEVVTGEDGTPVLDATVGNIDVAYDLASEDINLANCSIDTLESVLNVLGLSLYDFVLGMADSQLQSSIADLGPQIESAIEDAFSQASISQELDLNGAVVQLDLFPSDVDTTPEGLRIHMNGAADASEPAACVADRDPGASEAVDSELPELGAAPDGISPDYHFAALVSDDFGNQALYALWRGGALCYDVDEETAGIALDTSLLGMFAGDAFDDLFPESEPLVITTRPQAPPTMSFDSGHDAAVHLEDFGLDFYGELDDRQARILGVALTTDVGVDLALDGAAGQLAIEVDPGTEAMTVAVVANEFAPDATADIEADFGTAFDTLLGSVLGSALGDLTYDLPAYEGLGLTDLAFAPAGDASDWLGGYAEVGPVSYEGSGCGGDGGGCGGGCASSGRARGRFAALLALPLALVALRRRR